MARRTREGGSGVAGWRGEQARWLKREVRRLQATRQAWERCAVHRAESTLAARGKLWQAAVRGRPTPGQSALHGSAEEKRSRPLGRRVASPVLLLAAGVFPTATPGVQSRAIRQTGTERGRKGTWERDKVKLAKERGRQGVRRAKEGVAEGNVTLRAETEEALGTRDVKEPRSGTQAGRHTLVREKRRSGEYREEAARLRKSRTREKGRTREAELPGQSGEQRRVDRKGARGTKNKKTNGH
ncbi:hypothetical protein ERJ75_001780800 [Trypanosoma vivax]|nr:hypothetical protein ERJ75_001780800 [Trypanosoma vivax]